MTTALPRPVPVRGAGVASAAGFSWRGLAQAARDGGLATKSVLLSARAESQLDAPVPAIPPALDGDPKARRLMSRSSRLALAAMRGALADARWETGPAEIGCFLGVGASGPAMDDFEAMLAASLRGGPFSLTTFGKAGLAAGSPLFAFQIMNNFTLCHGAIALGLQGPNAAFFSRGAGTIRALREAAFSLLEGQCHRALAGGADTALHPVARLELARSGRAQTAGEGAAVFALGDGPGLVLAELVACGESLTPDKGNTLCDGTAFGEALAASPALAVAVALDLIATEGAERVCAAAVDPDGVRWSCVLQRPA